MKRCPQCARDYNDDSLSFCLDDGAGLLFGPASSRSELGAIATGFLSGDEPATRVLSEPAALDHPNRQDPPFGDPGAGGQVDGESATRPQIHTTDQTAIFPRGSEAEPQESPGGVSEKQSFSAHRAAKPLIGAVIGITILISGYFTYRYFGPTKQIESIAVMPFVNESGNADLEYLSDGMTEALIKSLSAIPNLAVKSRSAVFYYKSKDASPKKVGDELGVQAVLLGHISNRGESFRLSLELVNTQTQDVIWTDQFDAPRSDVVGLQSMIARNVATTLRARLSGEEKAKVANAPTTSSEAYSAYLKGRYYFNSRGADNLSRSIDEFKRAIDIDPNFALAYSGLADSYAIYSDYSGESSSEIAPTVQMYAERAIAIDPNLAEPHATLGILNIQNRNWDEALRESKQAVDLDPNYPTGVQWYASVLLDLGRYDEAAVMMKRAQDLDPVSPAISDGLSNTYEARDDFAAAIENTKKYIALNPSFPGAYRDLGLYYSITGNTSEAVVQAEKAAQIERASYILGSLGYVYGVAGKRDQALGLIRELEARFNDNRSPGRYIAEVYSGLGEKEKAMEWLEKDFQTKNGRLAEIRWTVPYRSMRDFPPFKDLLKRMGLPD